MNRRQAIGILMLALLLAGGRVLRRHVLLDPGGGWRDPALLDGILPDLPEAEPPPPTPPKLPIALNHAPAETLRFLAGIGPALASRIVRDRDENGPFRDLRDFQRVKGIGPKLAGRLAGKIHFAPADVETLSAAGRTVAPAAAPPGLSRTSSPAADARN